MSRITPSGGGGGLLTKTADSPYTATDTTSLTISDIAEYDYYMLFVHVTDRSGTGEPVTLQVNGDDTSNYHYVDQGGSRTTFTGPPEVMDLLSESTSNRISIAVEDGGFSIRPHNTNSQTGNTLMARTENVSWPLTQLTLSRGAVADFEVDLFGRTIA